ncbi:resolvase [Longispora urticae]
MRAKPESRERARELRMAGATLSEIVRELGVAKSSVSTWVRDVPTEAVGVRLGGEVLDRMKVMSEARWARHEERRSAAREEAMARGAVAATDPMIAAAAIAYWCEGSKSKPWRRSERLTFINSDPGLIALFLGFLRGSGVAEDQISYRLSIHETADVPAATRWWAERVGVVPERFANATLKRHVPTTRHNTDDHYHGCLIVDVRRSRQLYWFVEGAVRAVIAGVGHSVR